ncbi:hypothetical protein AC1031_013165 [Aphanomyces cochlioides]|nr:hypothetical protein AC1031_013165 [Aphanomyces cochlioides]
MAKAMSVMFLRKLGRMLDYESSNILSWHVDGSRFTIKDKDAFTKRVLPKYFKDMTYNTFKTELESLGFNQQDGETFEHPTWTRRLLRCLHHVARHSIIQSQEQQQESQQRAVDSNPLFQRWLRCYDRWTYLIQPAIIVGAGFRGTHLETCLGRMETMRLAIQSIIFKSVAHPPCGTNPIMATIPRVLHILTASVVSTSLVNTSVSASHLSE